MEEDINLVRYKLVSKTTYVPTYFWNGGSWKPGRRTYCKEARAEESDQDEQDGVKRSLLSSSIDRPDHLLWHGKHARREGVTRHDSL